MQVLIVQCSKERKNRIPDFPDQQFQEPWIRVSSVGAAIEAIHQACPKVVIVDVEIENGGGFRVFEETTDVTYEKIILTEAPNHVVKSIRFNVAQYLLKPMQADVLLDAVRSSLFKRKESGIQRLFASKFNNSALARVTHFFLPADDTTHLVESRMVMMAENLGYLRRIWLLDGRCMDTGMSLGRIAKLLRGHGFLRVGDDVLLQPSYVIEILSDGESTTAEMCSGREIPVTYQVECRIRHHWSSEKGAATGRK